MQSAGPSMLDYWNQLEGTSLFLKLLLMELPATLEVPFLYIYPAILP